MENEPRKEKLWSKDFILVIIATTGTSFCNYFFNTTLPIYAKMVTGTTAYVGLMLGAFTFSALSVRPFSGILSDKIGRTKLLILGALICTLACILYTFAGLFVLIVIIRALHGVGFGVHSTSAGAMVADVVPKSHIAEGLGYFAISATIAAAVGPGIALSIIGNGELKEFRTLFILGAGISVVSLIADCFITYERKNRQDEPKKQDPAAEPCSGQPLPKTFWGFESGVFLPALVNVLLYVSLSSVMSFLALFALDRNLGNIGLFFTVNALGMFVSRLFLGRIADRHGLHSVIIPSILFLVAVFLLIPFVHSLVFLLILAFPYGLAQGAAGPTINTLMFRRCSPERRGTTSAAFFSSIDIGYGVGSILFGFVADWFNYNVVFFSAALIALVALIVYLSTGLIRRRIWPLHKSEIPLEAKIEESLPK